MPRVPDAFLRMFEGRRVVVPTPDVAWLPVPQIATLEGGKKNKVKPKLPLEQPSLGGKGPT